MLPSALWLLCVAALSAKAADTSDYISLTGSLSTVSSIPTSDFEGTQYTYLSATGQSTISSASLTASNTTSGFVTSSTSGSGSGQSTASATSHSLTALVGGAGTTSTAGNGTGTATSTSSAARATNTLPCNNYPEFCNRAYSNITEVCAHNSAFSIKNNAASNQALTITQQLNDGIRMRKFSPILSFQTTDTNQWLVQGETHWVNDTVYNCHTSCSLLNAGTWQSSLETLVTWLEANPYDVVTWLIVNSDFSSGTTASNYTAAIEASGIRNYLYEPEYVPQHRDQWPTLGEMILSGKRVVMFMDYNANQTEVPYILDEFTHMWETPYSPTNQSFPCTQQRPPGLSTAQAKENYMYLANHNLNLGIDLGALTGGSSSETILIPDTARLNVTNGEYDQYGQLAAASQNCTCKFPSRC